MTRPASPARSLGAPLDREDVARLWMDTPENPMIVTALLRLDGRIDFGTFTGLVQARALAHDRLRARIVRPLVPFSRPRWHDDGKVSAADHVEHVRLARGASEGELAQVVSRIASERLDRRRPLWRMWLIDDGDGRSAIVVRIHHVIADGIALLGVLYGFSDEGAATPSRSRSRSRSPSPSPSRSRASAPPRGHLLRRAAGIARLVARRADAPAVLAGHPRGSKALAWSDPIAVESIRAAAHAVDAHVNDVVLGALAGAVRALVARDAKHGAPPSHPIHALVPVALPHAAGALGNHYTSLFVALPIDVAGQVDRVIAARDAMHAARAASGVELGRSLLGAAVALRAHVERIGVRVLSRRATLVLSNVAGPVEPLHIAGRRIDSILFASPASGSLGISASAFSYAGQLRLTVATDTAVVSDPWSFVRLFEAELRATLDALLGGAPRTA